MRLANVEFKPKECGKRAQVPASKLLAMKEFAIES
jgi:hypothetical protein